MLAILWIANLVVSAILAAVTGVSAISFSMVGGCAIMMWYFLEDSGDILDARSGFYLAVLLFIAIPSVVLAGEFGRNGVVWHSDIVPRLTVQRDDFDRVQLIIALGIGSVTAAMLLCRRTGPLPPSEATRVAGTAVFITYVVSVVVGGALTLSQYGSLSAMLLSSINPAMRLETASTRGSGITGILVFVLAVSAYYLCRRMRIRSLGLPLFLPVLLMVLPLANRGIVVEIMLIMALAFSDLRVRAPFRTLLVAALLLPPFAGSLLVARNSALSGTPDYSLVGLYRGFAGESPMVHVFAMTLQAMREGAFDYTYGLDLLMFPLWYVPRVLWTTKPMPLDFRLNAALGLNNGTAFGTPVSLFGGIYLNFTMLAYVPVLIGFGWILASSYRRARTHRLVALLLFVFVMDIVRVGDLSRELLTLSVGLFAAWFVNRIAVVAPTSGIGRVVESSAQGARSGELTRADARA